MTYARSQDFAMVALFCALTAIGSFIAIPLPFSPVPLTLQTFFVLLSGIVLGPRKAALSQVIYLLSGFLGIPVFAQGTAGIGVLIGPTGGYLAGFVAAAWIVGWLTGTGQKNSSLPGSGRLIAALLIGQAAIYVPGLMWLKATLNLSFGQACVIGLLPFIPGDIIKTVCLIILTGRLRFRICPENAV